MKNCVNEFQDFMIVLNEVNIVYEYLYSVAQKQKSTYSRKYW